MPYIIAVLEKGIGWKYLSCREYNDIKAVSKKKATRFETRRDAQFTRRDMIRLKCFEDYLIEVI